MAQVTLRGNPINTNGELPATGSDAPDFTLTGTDLNDVSKGDYAGKTLILNIFPSVDTPTCAASVRTFNEQAANLDNAKVLCVSNDLPFALGRFCGAEGIENVASASGFRSSFASDYGVELIDGPLKGLMARSVVVIDGDGKVIYQELVGETADEPDYDAAISAAS